jgi:superfamily II DNA or RNA helicase
MQELPPVPRPGSTIGARGNLWSVVSIEPGDGCTLVDLIGADADVPGIRRTLIVPFDEFAPGVGSSGAKRLRLASAMRGLASLIADAVPWPAPKVVVSAAIDVLPHQLSAALAFRTGTSRRVLVADAVGSGKTIQAGIAIADTLAVERDGRVLILVPAGLRSQWHTELSGKFGLVVDIVDGAVPVQGRWAEEAESPWARPGTFLSSFDYVKRPEVLSHLRDLEWHLVVVDEAHHATGGTERGVAIDLVCRRGHRVLLLTATPHDGDETRYQSLRALGRLDGDEVLSLRRAPRRAGADAERREHRILVEPSDDERHARTLLARYVSALRDCESGISTGGTGQGARSVAEDLDSRVPGSLLASVFEKRATSSPAALERTARRRLSLLAPVAHLRQPSLFAGAKEDDAREADDESCLALAGPMPWPRERAWLGALAEASQRAARSCSKLAALRSLLRRLREPAIVFTESRDTLAWLASELRPRHVFGYLHGLQSPAERQQQLDAFAAGAVRVLLATDVAAEGLNLQARCRLVIEFDTPWTPMRSEQRIGRVDRLGQRRRVHAWTLSTLGEPEGNLAAVRQRRRAVAAEALPGPAGTAGQLEKVCAVALSVAKRLARGASTPWGALAERADSPSSQTCSACAMFAGRPRIAFASPRRFRKWAMHSDSALLVAHAVLACGNHSAPESLAIPLITRVGRRQGTPSISTLASEALENARHLARARADELQAALTLAARNHARWAAQVRAHATADTESRLRQRDLFLDPEEAAAPVASPLADEASDETMHVFVGLALMVMPRDQRGLGVRP